MLRERFHDLFSVKVFSASSALISGRRVRLRSITLRFSYSRGGFYKLSLWDELKPVFFFDTMFFNSKNAVSENVVVFWMMSMMGSQVFF